MTYQAKITSKGQITLPAELREHLRIGVGDTVEFYLDHLDRVCLRPRYAGVDELFNAVPPRAPDRRYPTDDDAIAAAVLAKDARSRRKAKASSK